VTALGANTYANCRIDEQRTIALYIIAPDEMILLEKLRTKCQEKYCDIPEDLLRE
jgi:hypothetical protein